MSDAKRSTKLWTPTVQTNYHFVNGLRAEQLRQFFNVSRKTFLRRINVDAKKTKKFDCDVSIDLGFCHANQPYSWSRLLSKFNSRCLNPKSWPISLKIQFQMPESKIAVVYVQHNFFITKKFRRPTTQPNFCVSRTNENISEKN